MAMASVTMVCSVCGKEYEIRKQCYNRKEANKFEEWMQNQDGTCPNCYSKMMREKEESKHQAENEAAANKALERGLPPLQGTAKQVAWANTIREGLISILNINPELTEDEQKEAQKVIDYISSEFVKASFWIENRNKLEKVVKDAIEYVHSQELK